MISSKSNSKIHILFLCVAVITLCEEEACPIINSTATKLHWPMPDPAKVIDGSDAKTIMESYRRVRDGIELKIMEFKSSL